MTEDEAYQAFLLHRWPNTNGEPVCPHCGADRHYTLTTRRRFKCATCKKQFSATAGTMYANRKMAFASLMRIIDGPAPSALSLRRDIGCQYKTAYVALQKQLDQEPSRWIGYWQRAPSAARPMERK